MEQLVTGTNAEVIDFQAYRARRARAAAESAAAAYPTFAGLTGFGPFVIPMAFVVFWSPWFVARLPAAGDGEGGHSAA